MILSATSAKLMELKYAMNAFQATRWTKRQGCARRPIADLLIVNAAKKNQVSALSASASMFLILNSKDVSLMSRVSTKVASCAKTERHVMNANMASG